MELQKMYEQGAYIKVVYKTLKKTGQCLSHITLRISHWSSPCTEGATPMSPPSFIPSALCFTLTSLFWHLYLASPYSSTLPSVQLIQISILNILLSDEQFKLPIRYLHLDFTAELPIQHV